jgi:hypothetical protein
VVGAQLSALRRPGKGGNHIVDKGAAPSHCAVLTRHHPIEPQR